MTMDSLGEFVRNLRRAGELVEIGARVDPHLEISEITDRVVKAGGPALLFTRVAGSSYPVLTNQVGSERRMAMAFGAASLDEVEERIRRALDPRMPSSVEGKLGKLFSLADFAGAIPRTVTRAAVQEVVEDTPDLRTSPDLW
jgi:4-hydroxy-3-polyprenylbenzoate decarboxylase